MPRRQFESTYKSCLKRLMGELFAFAREDFQTIWNWLFDTGLISKGICSSIPERYSVKSVLYSQPSPVESLESFFRFLFTLWKINEFCLQRLQIPQTPCCRILINSYFYTGSAQVSGTCENIFEICSFITGFMPCAVLALGSPLCYGGWSLLKFSSWHPVITRSMSQTSSVLQISRERHFLSWAVTFIFAFLSPKGHKFGPASL